jgi:Family of unknown function (DUF5677)
LLLRERPASEELTEDARRLAYQVPEYGCALFAVANAVRPDHRVRDLVTAALLRRAVITLEGIRALTFAGLYEPAIGVARTLQDIELSIKLILRDDTDDMARALAAWHFLQYERHGRDMLKNPATREGMLKGDWTAEQVRLVAKNYASLLRSETFDSVRHRFARGGAWHNFDRLEDAFAAVGLEGEYFMTYDAASWFVHASNIDHDMVDGSGTEVTFRAFVDRDPARTGTILGLALLKSLELYELIAADRQVDVDAATGASAAVQIDGKEPERVSSLAALQLLVMREFDVRKDAPFRREAP